VIAWNWSINMNQWTPQQDAKSNNDSQDDEQHNAALRRRNHKKNKIYVEITYLDWKKEKKKMHSDSSPKNDLKPPLLNEWKRNKTYREVGVSLTKKLDQLGFYLCCNIFYYFFHIKISIILSCILFPQHSSTILFRVNYTPLPSKMLEIHSPPLLC